jgi:hypothetical protein
MRKWRWRFSRIVHRKPLGWSGIIWIMPPGGHGTALRRSGRGWKEEVAVGHAPSLGWGRRASLTAISLLCTLLLPAGAPRETAQAAGPTLANPILFVTQVPVAPDFTTIGSVFGNQLGSLDFAFRGGDLYIRYADGTLKNLTQAAGYGNGPGFQGATSIAVRDPSVHWSGQKALFSMVVGGASKQYDYKCSWWELLRHATA